MHETFSHGEAATPLPLAYRVYHHRHLCLSFELACFLACLLGCPPACLLPSACMTLMREMTETYL